MRFGNLDSLEPQAIEVELDGLAHIVLDLCAAGAGGYASGQVRRIGGVTRARFFDDNEVFLHFFNPACLRMLFSVPGASSSFRLHGTVTNPFLEGCRYWW